MNYFELGVEAYNNKNYLEAKNFFAKEIELDANNIVAYHNYGICCVQCNLNEEAVKYFLHSCSAGYIESYISIGAAYRNLGKYSEALKAFANAFALDPNHSTAYSNYSNTLRELGYPERALDFIKIANKIKPDNTSLLNESITYLSMGDLTEGWKKYNYRWYYETGESLKPNLPGPEFDGSQNLQNAIVLVYCEQGFGDCIQFARYIHLLREKGAKVNFFSKKPLTKLFQYNFPDVNVIDWGESIPDYTYHVALLDLPKCFDTTIDNIPYSHGYISVDEKLRQYWKVFLGNKSKLRIGLNWTSNGIAYNTKFRKIDLSYFNQLVSQDYDFISLSIDPTDREINLLAQLQIKNYQNKLGDFYNTAGLISNLDCVITVDTVTAHLAGAMGIPTLVLLPSVGCDWRWFYNRTDSPFYNSVKLFRQVNNDWVVPFNDIKTHLKYIG